MAGHRRWEGDETGRGVAGARHLTEPVDALRTAMDEPDWVAEDPEAHLLPHIRSGLKGGMRITRAEVSDEGELVVHLAVALDPGLDRPKAELRSVAFALLGRFAEPSTFVEERRAEGGAEFVVVTGQLPGQTTFLPHGHTVRLVIRASDTLPLDGS